MIRKLTGQGAFNFDIPAPEPEPVKPDPPRSPPITEISAQRLDREGHKWWADIGFAKANELLGKAMADPTISKDLSESVSIWKQFAAKHQRMYSEE